MASEKNISGHNPYIVSLHHDSIQKLCPLKKASILIQKVAILIAIVILMGQISSVLKKLPKLQTKSEKTSS
jgi:hypothetical protein